MRIITDDSLFRFKFKFRYRFKFIFCVFHLFFATASLVVLWYFCVLGIFHVFSHVMYIRTSAIVFLEMIVAEMTYYLSIGTLNRTYLL